MKKYDVRCWINADGTVVKCSMVIFANNANEACKICKDCVKENFGWNIFRLVAKRVGGV